MLPKPISKLKTGRKSTYLLPVVCVAGLLVALGLMISPISSIRQLGISGDAYASVTSGSATGGSGDTGTTTTPASVSMVFDKDTVTNEQVDVVAGTPVASEAKYFTIAPSGSVEKYSIYVQTSSSSNGSLVASNTNNNATIATLADKTTGVPLSNLGTNTWGYALSTGRQTTSSMLYKGLSGSTNAISAYDSAANPTSAQDFTLAFAANIGTDKPADHYVANVLVSVAANPGEVTTFYSVSYSTNGSTGGVTPATQTAESSRDTYTFKAPLGDDLERSGYKFLGWSESASATTAQYAPGATISLSAASPVKTLYAIWGFIYSITYNANGGSNAPSTQSHGTTATSHIFTVAAKGNITKSGYAFLGWAESDSATSAQYTAGSSQITLSSSNPSKTLYAVWREIFGGITNMNQLTTSICKSAAAGESGALNDTSSGNSSKSSYIVTKLKDGNCWMTENMNNSTGRKREESAYGGYYTNEGNGSSDGALISNSNAANVCAHMGGGWKLPTRDEYVTLMSGLSGSAIQGSPYNFKLGGAMFGSGFSDAGKGGRYWSSTALNSNNAYNLVFGSTYIKPSDSGVRGNAYSIRCIVQGS